MLELLDAGKTDEVCAISERLIGSLIHCPDPRTELGIEDLNSYDYRAEVLLCAVWMMWHANGAEPPERPCKAVAMKALLYDAPLSDNAALLAAMNWVLAPTTDRIDPDLYK